MTSTTPQFLIEIMAGDKVAEVPKSAQEFHQRPKAVKDAMDFYKKPAAGNAFRSAISRAVDSLLRRGKQLPSNKTLQRFADRMNSGSTPEPRLNAFDADGHPNLRRESQPTLEPHHNLRSTFEPMSDRGKAMRYFDRDQPEIKSQSTADETPKPSEE